MPISFRVFLGEHFEIDISFLHGSQGNSAHTMLLILESLVKFHLATSLLSEPRRERLCFLCSDFVLSCLLYLGIVERKKNGLELILKI